MQIGETTGSGGMLRLGNLGNLAAHAKKERQVLAVGWSCLHARPGSTCSTVNRVALSGTWLVAEVVNTGIDVFQVLTEQIHRLLRRPMVGACSCM
jgi:hypothetical protein